MNVFQYAFMFIIVCAGIVFLIMYIMQRSMLALTYTFETFTDNEKTDIDKDKKAALDADVEIKLTSVFQKMISADKRKESEESEQKESEEEESKESEEKESKIGIVSMMKNPKNLDHWLKHHRDMGIAHFYIRLEDSPEWESHLSESPDVTLFVGSSSGVNEYEAKQVRQTKMVNNALKDALSKKYLDWLIQIDSDELLSGDLEEIRALPETVRTCWMKNVEAVYDAIPGKDDMCFQAARFRECSKGECVSYANGKGAGRVASDVASNGSHRFKSSKGAASEKMLKKVLVQHYESCDYDLYKEKYTQLSKSDMHIDIPFSYYNESIKAANMKDEDALQCVYTKHRTVLGDAKDECFE